MNAAFEAWLAKEYHFVAQSMKNHLLPCWKAAQAAQRKKDAETVRNYLDREVGEVYAKAIEEQES